MKAVASAKRGQPVEPGPGLGVDMNASSPGRAQALRRRALEWAARLRVDPRAIRIQAMRNNGGVQGRTLVELQQARGIPVQTMSDDEGIKKRGFGYRIDAR